MSGDPIAYTYEADTHCPPCTEARFGRGKCGHIAEDCAENNILDSEGNIIGAIAPWDEWCEPTERFVALVCGTCRGVIESHEHKTIAWTASEDDPRVDHMPTVEDNY